MRLLYQVLRGGGWCCGAALCRVDFRSGFVPEIRDYDLGFRCARRVT